MCACFLRHLTWEGRRGWFAPGWTVGLLTAVYYNAEAQAQGPGPHAWCYWQPADHGQRAWRITGGLN
jgi:hypothetical protein